MQASPTTNDAKKPNPRANANPISAVFFTYLMPTLWRNFRDGVKEEDLFDILDSDRSTKVGDELESEWNETHKTRRKYALHLALCRIFYKDLIITGILQGIKEIGTIIVMPYTVGKLVSFFGGQGGTFSKNSAYVYAAAIVACLLIERIIAHTVWMWLKHISMKVRVGCCSLVYRKSLRLSFKSLQQTNIGQIVNLLSNDVSKIDVGFILCHYVWTAPVQAVVATYILYNLIGVAAFTGMLFILSIVPLQIYMGKRNSLVRLKTAHRTDERVRIMNEILAGIHIIKMYAWEKPFAKLISLARRLEMKSIRLHFYIESFIFSLDMFVSKTAIFITIIIYVYYGNQIDADLVYSITATYSVIRTNITIIFSVAVACLGEAHITISRLEQFLSFEENNHSQKISEKEKESNKGLVEIPKVIFKNVTAKWSPTAKINALSELNLSINQSQLTAVIGPVGSGKSAFLNVILNELPVYSGDLEIVGRISYASQEPWLFLGTVRQNIIFDDSYEEDRYQAVVKVCALESDFKMFPQGDLTMVRDKGKSLSGGQRARINLARCVYKQADIYLLDDPLSAVDTKVGKMLYEECVKTFLRDKICILITHQLQYLQTAEKIVILNNGKIAGSGTYNELQSSTLDFAKLLKEIDTEENPDDKPLTKAESFCNEFFEDQDSSIEKEAISSGRLKFSNYLKYFKMGGNYFHILGVVLVILLAHATSSGGDYFLSHWINYLQAGNNSRPEEDIFFKKDNVAPIYAGITAATIILGLAHSTVFFLFLVRASSKIHDTIMEKIIYATMQFFNKNPSGRILNRFSKDLGIVDEYIPFVFIDVVDVIFVLLAAVVLSCTVNAWLLLPCGALLFVLYFIRIVYIKTSRQVKRIEGITRSPIYNHAAASMNGLTTIRAFKAQQTLIKEYDHIQDHHSSAWYTYISSSEAFGLWIDITCISFVGIIMFTLLLISDDYYGGDIGLIITIYIALIGMLQWGIFQWSELENNMTSVERVLEYTKQEMEPIRPPVTNLPQNWPEFGKVVFDNVSMKYETNGDVVLKNLNFTINPGEKVGVVGRTGAGKTSTISALFQFYPLTGAIIIDGVDTTKVPLETLRSKMSIIPQECVLFSGTMRKNLDPFDEYMDEVLWSALEQVEIKKIIELAPGGLNSPITESGANFSIGQRQLICLARAIIRNSTIIVMDEATANIDSYTDALIQKTIRNTFAKCTIITVAHRLHTIIDSDKVIVMNKGAVVEFDSPHNLLQNKHSIFYSMVQTTGSASAKQLKTLAEESYNRRIPIASTIEEL